jgi:uncharacterized SAM-binding protein YcdF (DUF218 family)
MFELGRLLWLLLDPLTLLLIGISLACLVYRRYTRTARCLLVASLSLLWAMVVFPLGDWLLRPLEQRFAAPVSLPAHIDGIIVLGGAQQPALTAMTGQPQLNAAAERLTSFVALVRRFPAAKRVMSGGSGVVIGAKIPEAETSRLFLAEQGVDPNSIIWENRSRNTVENVRFSQQLLQPKAHENWLLITSASHMPRAMGVFQAHGWRVIPYPVDVRALPGWPPPQAGTAAMGKFAGAWYEWLGLSHYWIQGYSHDWLPAPAK